MHRFVLPIIHHALLLLAFRYSLKPNFTQHFLRIFLDRAFLLEFREPLGIRRLTAEVVHRLTDGAEVAGREIADRVEPVKFAVKNSTASSESELFEFEKISKKSLSSTSRFQLDAKFLKSRNSCLKSQPSLTLFLNLCIVYFPFRRNHANHLAKTVPNELKARKPPFSRPQLINFLPPVQKLINEPHEL